jgi:molybdate transport system ATP-binding protein/molybdate/tungstate transport system ATP-binding protein
MLELVNVTKKFRGGFRLGPINLKVNDNEILVMIGPTGSGKTTILNLISGLLKPDSGSICINGVDITNLPVEFRKVGYIFQNPSLFPHLNVYENISFGLSNKRRRSDGESIDDLGITKLIKDLEISHLLTRYIQGLSGGEIQKVSLARMLVTRPRVMLMDEPLSHLDNSTKRKLRLQLRRILKERQTMPTIYVTHFEEDVYSLADSVSILQNGLIEHTAKLETLLTYQNNNNDNNSTSLFQSNVFSNEERGGGGNYLEGNVIKSKDGVTIFKMGPHLLEIIGDYSIGCKVGIIVRPEDIILSKEIVKTSARNVVRAKVLKTHNNHHHNTGVSNIHLITEGGFYIISRITNEAKIDLGIKPDDVVCAIFKASSPHVVRQEYHY